MKKRKSLKLKITLWFTLVLTVICILFFSVMLTAYQTADKKLIKHTLIETVEEFENLLENEKRYQQALAGGDTETIQISEFYDNNVQLMIYTEDGGQAIGLFLYPELDNYPYSEKDAPQKIEISGMNYYYYDEWIKVRHGDDYYIRGLIPAEDSFSGVIENHGSVLLGFVLLLITGFAGGYWLTGRFLRPVRTISYTADAIRTGGDLTKRIPTTDSEDELDMLAHTINAMFDRIENNFEAEKQFTSNASHELRTPVSVILAQCDYAFDNADNPEEILQALASVQKQGYKMSGMIETLLIFTRMEQKTERYQKQNLNLTELISSVCEDFRLIADKNITVTESLEENIMLNGNPELFMLLVSNLIQNAVRYGRENGFVRVELKQNANQICLYVTDNGTGISEKELPHIWERFYRSDKARSSKGLGMGLALVRQIAEFHGGTVSAVSQEGTGSTFSVMLPK
ncbi:MAG: HAMP domain-containing histidine kinase [Oscillospiraceae bacterium]|nr:HAMP domain-containing histidine kinase [Oscillospiraceae bacterium]